MEYIIVILIVELIGIIQSNIEPCPEGYSCSWEKRKEDNIYLVLQCKLLHSGSGLKPIETKIDDNNMPSNATRLAIWCYGQEVIIDIKVDFGRMEHIQHLSFKDISLLNKSSLHFPTMEDKLLSLSLDNVDIKEINFGSLRALTSLKLQNIISLEKEIYDLTFSKMKNVVNFHFDNIASNRFKLTLYDMALALRNLLYNYKSPVASLTLKRIQKTREKFKFDKFFLIAKNVYIKSFDLSWNMITDIEGDPNFYLPNLEKFSIANNLFENNNQRSTFWHSLISHDNLKDLDMSNTSTNENKDSQLNLKFKCPFEKDIFLDKFGANYRTLVLYSSAFLEYMSLLEKPICLTDQNTIKYVDLTGSRTSRDLELMLAFTYIEYLSLQDTHLVISDANIFSLFKQIKYLLLGKNNLKRVIEEHTHLFENNINLRSLDLSGCGIGISISPNIFSPLQLLTHLNLSSNINLQSISGIHFENLKFLRFINLSETGLKQLDKSTLDGFSKLPKLVFDMSEMKSLKCTDDLLMWIPTTISTIISDDDLNKFTNIENTFCMSSNGKRYFSDLRKINYTGVKWVRILIITLSIIVILSVIGTIVWYKFRWKMELFIHTTKKKFKMQVINDKGNSEYVYDVFICYNKCDRTWVTETLVPKVESNRLTTLIHERDYLPGSVIEDAIKESLMTSRFVLFVITKNFLESDWCMTELRMAKEESTSRAFKLSTKGTEMLIPVLLSEDISLSDIDQAGILNRSFLQWPEKKCQGHSDKLALFWDKLLTKLSSGGNIRK